MENIAWSPDQVLDTCKELLRDRVREGLVRVSALKSGGPLLLKKMIDIVTDVDDSALRSLTESLQSLRLKDVPGENDGTAVRYLKGTLFLFQNCSAVPTDTMGRLNDVMTSMDCEEFTGYMKSIYFASKRERTVGGYVEYLDTAEDEYMTLYREGNGTNPNLPRTQSSWLMTRVPTEADSHVVNMEVA